LRDSLRCIVTSRLATAFSIFETSGLGPQASGSDPDLRA